MGGKGASVPVKVRGGAKLELSVGYSKGKTNTQMVTAQQIVKKTVTGLQKQVTNNGFAKKSGKLFLQIVGIKMSIMEFFI